MMADVSRETLARPDSGYTSPYRLAQGERTRQALIGAALDLMAKGDFRPEARAIAARAGVHKSAVTRHFGSRDLLCRIIAREHWAFVADSLGLPMGGGVHDRQRLVWLILVGKPRELS